MSNRITSEGAELFKGAFKGDSIIDPKRFPLKDCVDVTGGTTPDCVNTPVPIFGLPTGAIAKIPVVLAELNVQINVNSVIDLPEPAFEIKRVKKRLKVTQCLLLQDTNMLFLKGFVRKNIEFSTASKCHNKTGFCGDIRHCTVDVPWSCTTPVVFNGVPPLPIEFAKSKEFVFFRVEDLERPDFADKDQLLSSDLSEFNQNSTEFFNELPFCELVSSRIVEFDETLDRIVPMLGKFPFEEKGFKKIEEKMVIFLTLKLLQKQQVAISPIFPIPKKM